MLRLFGLTDHVERFLGNAAGEGKLSRGHTRPRTYNLYPFDIDEEVRGAARRIEKYCPAGKKVKILQWSGSTVTFGGMLAAVRQAGMRNINGGDSRFDPEYPS